MLAPIKLEKMYQAEEILWFLAWIWQAVFSWLGFRVFNPAGMLKTTLFLSDPLL